MRTHDTFSKQGDIQLGIRKSTSTCHIKNLGIWEIEMG